MTMTNTLKALNLWPLLAMAALLSGATAAHAQFEVNGLDIEKGSVELDYQGDTHFGQPNRRFQTTGTGPAAETLFDENEVNRQRHNIELGLGLTDALQISVGAEFEQQRIDDPATFSEASSFGELIATSIQIEGTYVVIPSKPNGFGLGLYGQLEPAVQPDDANHFSVGPIMTASQGPWSVALNPWIGHLYGGADNPAGGGLRDERWSFEYAWQAAYQVNEQISVAVEGYGIVNRLGDSGHPSEASLAFGDQDQHRIGPVVYYTFEPGSRSVAAASKNDDGGADDDDGGAQVTMSLGLLMGLNENTSDTALKWGMEVEF